MSSQWMKARRRGEECINQKRLCLITTRCWSWKDFGFFLKDNRSRQFLFIEEWNAAVRGKEISHTANVTSIIWTRTILFFSSWNILLQSWVVPTATTNYFLLKSRLCILCKCDRKRRALVVHWCSGETSTIRIKRRRYYLYRKISNPFPFLSVFGRGS